MKQLGRKIIRFYSRDMKLQYKFLLSHFILVLLPTLVVSILIYNQLSAVLLSNLIHAELALGLQTANSLENVIMQVDNASKTLMNNPFFNTLLQDDKNTLEANLKSQSFRESALSFLHTAATTADGMSITDVKIYLPDSYSPLYEDSEFQRYRLFIPDEEIRGSYWHGIFSSTKEKMLVCPRLYLTPREADNYGEFAIARKVTLASEEKPSSIYLLVYYSKPHIDSILNKNISVKDSATYLVNKGNTLVSLSNAHIAGKYFLRYDELKKNIPDTANFQVMTFAADRAYVSYREISGTDWLMVSVLPVNSIQNQNRTTLWQFALAYLIILAVAFVASLRLSNSIVRRIASVITQMKRVQNNRPVSLTLERDKDEIGDLIATYNYMSEEINQLLDNEEKAAEDLRVAEFKALQSQINPHFLYNTLDMINWLSKSGRTTEVADAVLALSQFYKLTLGQGKIVTSIREELSQVSLYVKLQNMRYKDCIAFLVDVSEDLLDFEIPKFVLQPIVENSIQHGIFEKQSKTGSIVITGWMEADYVVLILSDDGVGMPPAQMNTILKNQPLGKGHSNIGIANTHKRLQLYYKQDFGLAYSQSPEGGIEVEIRFPARRFTE